MAASEGPYRVVKSSSGTFVCAAAPGLLAEVRMCRTGQDVEADARLLAASWELLEIAEQSLAAFSYMAINAKSDGDKAEFRRRADAASAIIARVRKQ